MTKQRAQFSTRLGVIATSVGSAVGLGNIWRFPYETGVHGGAAFLLVYVACVFLIGLPIICAEFVMGRGTHKNVVGAFKQTSGNNHWHWIAYIGISASLMILSFYSVVAGWTLDYLMRAITGSLTGNGHNYSAEFSAFTSSSSYSIAYTLAFLLINFIILNRGVQKGIEKISNIMMPLLFVLLLTFCINSFTLPGFREGISFLFRPDFSKITPSVVISAMGQAFFSLSLGLSCLLIYSSYFSDKVKLVNSAAIVATLDTLVAIMAGFIIFPAVFSYGAAPQQGPTLVFEVFPMIFSSMPGGFFWAILFFLLLFFAALTSTISMGEISIAFFSEELKMNRSQATILTTAIAAVFGSLCALSFGVLSDFTICGLTIFNLFDYVSSNLLLPMGGMVFAIYVGWLVDKKFVRNQLTNYGELNVPAYHIIVGLMRYFSPVAVFIIFLYGLNLL